MKILSVFGTRPEAIKMCPLVKRIMQEKDMDSIVCVTGQHKEMLYQVLDIFQIEADYDLKIMTPNQTLGMITSKILNGMDEVLLKEKPDLVLVHGDTTTSFSVALSAFYHQIPVGHVEAGLRTYDKYSPFPEEMNRNLTGKIATLHFAPTIGNLENLKKENITEGVYVTGNTVIDAMKMIVTDHYAFKNQILCNLDFKSGKRYILMTAHRRENFGIPLENICHAVKRIAEEYADIVVIYPVHMNPKVRDTVNSILADQERVVLINPIDVEEMHNLMNLCYLVLTDSGGLQEEAPALGKPVLVMRTETERPEAAEAGTVEILGIEEENIYAGIRSLLDDKEKYRKMSKAVNPYGDGKACERIVQILRQYGKIQEGSTS
mgnify:CR=1 FL=1